MLSSLIFWQQQQWRIIHIWKIKEVRGQDGSALWKWREQRLYSQNENIASWICVYFASLYSLFFDQSLLACVSDGRALWPTLTYLGPSNLRAADGGDGLSCPEDREVSESHRSHQLPAAASFRSCLWGLAACGGLPSRSSAETQSFQASSAYVPAWERDRQPPGVCMMLGTLDTGRTKEHFMVASRGPGPLWNLWPSGESCYPITKSSRELERTNGWGVKLPESHSEVFLGPVAQRGHEGAANTCPGQLPNLVPVQGELPSRITASATICWPRHPEQVL